MRAQLWSELNPLNEPACDAVALGFQLVRPSFGPSFLTPLLAAIVCKFSSLLFMICVAPTEQFILNRDGFVYNL